MKEHDECTGPKDGKPCEACEKKFENVKADAKMMADLIESEYPGDRLRQFEALAAGCADIALRAATDLEGPEEFEAFTQRLFTLGAVLGTRLQQAFQDLAARRGVFLVVGEMPIEEQHVDPATLN